MTLRAAGAIFDRYGGRFCKEVALQRIRAQLDDLAQFGGGLHALGNDLHAAGVGVSHHIAQDLLLVRRGVDATDDGNIHLDEPGCKLQ